ncbi:hypothetical protein JJB07_06500 [Tumebacillus sp. ITR2]|uniref:Uncharacterized protein n=1 Tax=Tumebacillus amylolyticus TaxID=2801339 RepID=A0ABS1J7Q5_9BACL|nr:hypothetical protein [Tumebacillus amylolyticus]MBL0386303.1 hypothetical protein [Tumebacillus amylolyticus]
MKWIVIPLVNLAAWYVFQRMKKTLPMLENLVAFFISGFLCQICLVIAMVNLKWIITSQSKFLQLLMTLDSVLVFPFLVLIWLNKMLWVPRRAKWLYVLAAVVSILAVESLEVWASLYSFRSVFVQWLFNLSWIVVVGGTWVVWKFYRRFAMRGVQT